MLKHTVSLTALLAAMSVALGTAVAQPADQVPAPAPTAPAPAEPSTPVPTPPAPTVAPAPPAPAPPAPDAKETAEAQQKKEEGKKAAANLNAITTLPQLTAFRGGSLGIPASSQTAALQASVDAQLFGDKSNADTFAQLAGLQMSDKSAVDVFTELLDQDMPRFLHDGSSITHEIVSEKLSSAGMRYRRRFGDKALVSSIQTKACMDELGELVTASYNEKDNGAPVKISGFTLIRNIKTATDNPDRLKVRYRSEDSRGRAVYFDGAALPDCNLKDFRGVAGNTLWIGAHVLRRSPIEDGGTASNGGAGEVMFQHEGLSTMVFVGATLVQMQKVDDKAGMTKVEFPSFRIARLTAGFEHRGSHKSDDTDIVPRVGIYGAASHAWWHDPYGPAASAVRIQSTELELGFYAGGHFSDKFSGIIALRMTKPFGGEEHGTVFVLSLMPSASVSTKDQADTSANDKSTNEKDKTANGQ